MILPGRNLHSTKVLFVNLCVNNNKKRAHILRWLVGVNLGSFCAFVGAGVGR